MDEGSLLQTAVDAFVKELALENDLLLKGKVEIREVPAGTYLMQEESHKVTYFVHPFVVYFLLVSSPFSPGTVSTKVPP